MGSPASGIKSALIANTGAALEAAALSTSEPVETLYARVDVKRVWAAQNLPPPANLKVKPNAGA